MVRLALLLLTLFATGCAPHLTRPESFLHYTHSEKERADLLEYPDESAHITPSNDWGREILVGQAFAKEGDWYRALTSFRKARFLMRLTNSSTPELEARLAWSECLLYAFAGKWHEVTTTWEHYRDDIHISDPTMIEQWSILMFAAYTYEGWPEGANTFLAQLPPKSPIRDALLEWKRLSLLSTDELQKAQNNGIESLLASQMKSPQKARVMNACLPGLGYWYVGQKQTACTSFLLNASFLGAGIQLFTIHQPFLALITLSFEVGWYLGGITGAGIEAEEYNQRLKETTLMPYLRQKKGFPLLETKIGW